MRLIITALMLTASLMAEYKTIKMLRQLPNGNVCKKWDGFTCVNQLTFNDYIYSEANCFNFDVKGLSVDYIIIKCTTPKH